MPPVVQSRLAALAVLTAVAVVPSAQAAVDADASPATTAPPVVTTVKVRMTDAATHVNPKRAQRGGIVRFILTNVGKQQHSFALGHQRAGTATQTGFTRKLKPHEQSVLIFFLDFRGKLAYRGILPAERSNPRMKGIFTII